MCFAFGEETSVGRLEINLFLKLLIHKLENPTELIQHDTRYRRKRMLDSYKLSDILRFFISTVSKVRIPI